MRASALLNESYYTKGREDLMNTYEASNVLGILLKRLVELTFKSVANIGIEEAQVVQVS